MPAVLAAVKTLAVLSKRQDNIFFSRLTEIKAILKLLWPLLIVNLRIPGLVLVQEITQLLPCVRWRPIFRANLEGRRQHFSYFSPLTTGYGFGNCKSLFVNIQCHV